MASKVESNFNGEPFDFDGDGRHEILVSFQLNPEVFTINYEIWNPENSSWDVIVDDIPNEYHSYVVLI